MEHLSHYSATCKYKICLILIAFVLVTIFTNASPKSLSERTGKAVGKWTTPRLTPTMARAMPPFFRCF